MIMFFCASPVRILTAVWGCVFLLRVAPFWNYPTVPIRTKIFLTVCYLIFTLPFFVAAAPSNLTIPPCNKSEKEDRSTRAIRLAIIVFAIAGALGALVRGYDMFFLRGLDYSAGISAARLENLVLVEAVGAANRPLSAVGKLLMGCSTVAAMACLLRAESMSWRVRLGAAISIGLLLALSTLEGGRNTIAVNLIFLLSVCIVRRRCGAVFLPFGKWVQTAILLGALLALCYFLYIFTDRFSALGYTSDTVTDGIESAFGVRVPPLFSHTSSPGWQELWLGFSMLAVYISHGVDQIAGAIDWVGTAGYGWGAYNLDLVTVALERLGLPVSRYDFAQLPKLGLYLTAPGELVLDFGVLGTCLFLGGFGFSLGLLWKIIKLRKNISAELIVSFSLSALFASPLYSILPGFFGVVIAMFVFIAGTQHVKRRLS